MREKLLSLDCEFFILLINIKNCKLLRHNELLAKNGIYSEMWSIQNNTNNIDGKNL